eukprot:TRINITY_DN32054_c0_g1_i1.p2 TRINITY_DN32054_c0_g1~~TRINITY_DN32054_c0_g1_i1.p2  ORF type:complete len:312 (+),score=138.42 TRINITY_DN32054_c0_g1_i1:60-995(+)
MSWCLIESDPMVFNEMLERIGVKEAEVIEVPVLDVAELQRLAPVYGLIFLFKWKPVKRDVSIVEAPNVYFAKQIVTNACATQAIVNTLLNADGVEIGPELGGFKEFTAPLDPEARGECMGHQETLRTVHNSFARPQCFSFEDKDQGEEDVYHFSTYIPKDGHIYELDGLQNGPILASPESVDAAQWLEKAVPLLQERIAQVASLDTDGNGLMFSVLAVAKDRASGIEQRLAAPGTAAGEAAQLREELAVLKEQREAGRIENVRRRHSYIPFIVNCLKALAKKGVLETAATEAQKKAQDKLEERIAKKNNAA